MSGKLRTRLIALIGGALILVGALSDWAAPAGELAVGIPGRPAQPALQALLDRGSGIPLTRPETVTDMARAGAATAAARTGTIGSNYEAAHLAAFAGTQRIPSATTAPLANRWKELGPKPYHADDEEYTLKALGWDVVAGRMTALAVDPTDASGSRVWAGAAGGGVWYSEDAGTHWTPKFDEQPSLSVGAIAVDPGDPKRVFVGTGEPNYNQDAFFGTGIYRTTDTGLSWTRAERNIEPSSTVFKIIFAGDRMFAATNRGLFRSTDRGDSWHEVSLPTNAAGTAPDAGVLANVVTDVVVHPDKPSQITAAVGWRRGKKGCAADPPQADCSPGNGLYRSSDGGSVFERLPLGGLGEPGRSEDPIGRLSLAYAKGPGQDHNVMWAIVQDAGQIAGDTFIGLEEPLGNSVFNGVYRSGNDAVSWELKATRESFSAAPGTGLLALTPLYSPGVQSWYNQWVAVDPTDAERVLVGLEEIYQTTADANTEGKPAQWRTVGRYWNACVFILILPNGVNDPTPPCDQFGGEVYAGKTTHPDQHAGVFTTAGGAARLYAGNDGGVYRQDAGPTGYTNTGWTSLNDTLGTTQPYYAVIGGDGTVYAGFQDNGTAKIEPSGRASMIFGGDGFDVAVHPKNSNIIFEEYVGGTMYLSTDGGRNWRSIAPLLTSALFSTPFEMDELDVNGDGVAGEHLVLVANQIVETVKGEETRCEGDYYATVAHVEPACDWVYSFTMGTRGDGGPNWQSSAVDVRGPDIFVGTCGVCDVVTQAGGDETRFANGIATNVKEGCEPQIGTNSCWEVIERPKGLPNRYITDVAIDPEDRKTIYVTLMGYARRWFPPTSKNVAVGTGNVFVSHDAGRSFANISGNLPSMPANTVLVRDDRLYVGTDFGVFTAGKDGGAWTRLGTSMANASVWDLNLDPAGSKMVAATHGRGVWLYDFGAAAPSGGGGTTPRNPTRVLPRRTARHLPATGADPLVGVGVAVMAAAALVRRRISPR